MAKVPVQFTLNGEEKAEFVESGATLLKALRGRHMGDARVRHARDGHFALNFREPTCFEADGELHRTASDSCELATLPAVLRVVDCAGND